MGNKHTNVTRIAPYGVPLTEAPAGGVRSLLAAVDKAAAPANAIAELKEHLSTVRPGALIPSRVIRSILKRHGL